VGAAKMRSWAISIWTSRILSALPTAPLIEGRRNARRLAPPPDPKAPLKIPLKTATPNEMRKRINTEEEPKSDKPGVAGNYCVEMLDETKGAARLKQRTDMTTNA